MGKTLVIAEKPSVATDIARALGGGKREKDYLENDDYIISSAVGHLLELTVPEEFEITRGKWSFEKLPHMPPRFALKPIEKSENRLKVLQRLLKRKDVDAIINACDAGREGELIFRNIIAHTKAKQPVKRLWLQSMTPAAIREGFERLRTDEQMRPLADASVCRSEADWLVGINGTRAMTAFNSKTGGFHLTTVGRVQTPTLAIVVEREARIRKFVARDYWELHGTFAAAKGEYPGRWFDEEMGKKETEGERLARLIARLGLHLPDAEARLSISHGTLEEEHRSEYRVWHHEIAETLRTKCLGKPGVVTEKAKNSSSLSPLLYDLTSLQREANGRFGFSAKNTLGMAQALYEKHKVLTYPRTDSRALPEDYIGTVRTTMQSLGATQYAPLAGKILSEGWVHPNKRIFNNAKVSDHFAIIPTGQAPKNLSEPEQKLYDLVTKRFLAVFFPPAEFLITTRITRVEGEAFKSEGKVLVKPGWLEVYGKEAATDDTPTLVPVQQNETVRNTAVEVKTNVTKPPPRYTEATLLSAMESAGKLVDDEELREAMSERGLGTPATRAAIIEGLISEQYIHREQRELRPTAKAFSLITLLSGLGVETLTKPEMTGNWEYQLKQMERGELQRADFMDEIRRLTEDIVARAKRYEHDTIPGDFGKLSVPCPKCGGEIHENYKKFQCQKCDFALWKIAAGRQYEPAEIETLIREKQVGPLQGFRSKQGFPFAALVKLTPEFEAKFDFGEDKNENGEAVAVDFTGKEPVGRCPKCGASVFENGMNYVCEKSASAERTCDFKTGAIILQQAIDKTQIGKLLATGKTDLLQKFISKKNGRAFKAYLKLDSTGKVGFEFEPREAKSKGRPAKSKEPLPKIDFTGQQAIGKCPKCGGGIFETDTHYVCENSQAESKPCKFRSGKVILHQAIDRDQMSKLLATGRTDLLSKFISKSGRPFSAYLVAGEGGKIGFEFEESSTPSAEMA